MKKQILFVGIGGAGCALAEKVCEKQGTENCRVIALDTDADTIDRCRCPVCLSLADTRPIGELIEYIGAENLSEWFPCDRKEEGGVGFAFSSLRNGTGGVRAKGLFAFVNMLTDKAKRDVFHASVDSLFDGNEEYAETELYIAASLSGGTGSALFYAVALYIEKYVRERFNREINAKAFLISPEIYVNTMTDDEKMTAHANCYAALQELQTVNRFAYGDPSLPGVTFRIGQANEPNMGVLFDTSDRRFADKIYAPFYEIYLLDRVPGGAGFKAYLPYWADMIALFAKDVIPSSGKPESCEAIWQSLSLHGLVYSPDHVSSYFASRRVRDIINAEWLPFFAAVEGVRKNGVKYGTDGTGAFCEAVSAYVRDKCGLSGDERNLLSEARAETFAGEPENNWRTSFRNAVLDEYGDRFEDENKEILDKCVAKIKDPDAAVLHWYERRAKRERIAEYTELLRKAYRALDGYYVACVGALGKINAEMASGDFASSETFARLLRHIVCENGSYVNPIVALARLCLTESDLSCPHTVFRDIIASDVKRKNGVSVDALFTEAARTPYMSSDLISRVFADGYEEACIGEKLSEEDLIDMAGFTARVAGVITADLSAALLDNLLPYIDSAVEAYRRVMAITKPIGERLDEAVRLSLCAGNGFAGFYTNVGATESKKQLLFERYFDGAALDDIRRSEDAQIGKLIFERFFTENDIPMQNIVDMIGAWKADIVDRFENSAFYRTYCQKNVIEMLFDARSDLRRDNAARLLQTPPAPVRYKYCRIKGSSTVAEETSTIYISENCASSVCDKAKGMGIDTEKREAAISKFLYSIGNGDVTVSEDSRIADDEVFIVHHIRNLRLWQISEFNDCEDPFGVYKDFVRGSRLVEKRETPLRNPYLCKYAVMKGKLPFLNPEKQKLHDINTVKALVYAYAHGKIAVRALENEPDPVVFLNVRQGLYPITGSGALIRPDDVTALAEWIRVDKALADEWSREFDREITGTFAGIVNRNFFGTDPNGMSVFSSSPLIRVLYKDMLAHTDKKDAAAGSLIGCLARTAGQEKTDAVLSALHGIVSELCDIACEGADGYASDSLKTELKQLFLSENDTNGAVVVLDLIFSERPVTE